MVLHNYWHEKRNENLNQKHLGCKKVAAKDYVQNDTKSKWAAKGIGVLIVIEIKF